MVNLFENFTFTNTNPALDVPLDATNNDEYPATDTLTGDGNASIDIRSTWLIPATFPAS